MNTTPQLTVTKILFMARQEAMKNRSEKQGYLNVSPELEDAKALNLLYPKTFEVPTDNELSAIDSGDYVKVCAGGERFWCKIIEENYEGNGFFVGVIDNELINNSVHGLMYGNKIVIYKNNIYSIQKDTI